MTVGLSVVTPATENKSSFPKFISLLCGRAPKRVGSGGLLNSPPPPNPPTLALGSAPTAGGALPFDERGLFQCWGFVTAGARKLPPQRGVEKDIALTFGYPPGTPGL